MEEWFDVCDENGLPTGQVVERSVAHRDGIMHRTAHIWVVREKDGKAQVLLQKRSLNKDSFPGGLDTSSAGHIKAGDEPKESALRELKEELGIDAAPEDLIPIGQFRVSLDLVFHGAPFRDEEMANVFAYEKPVDIDTLVLQKEELDSVEWHDLEETERACRERNPRFVVPTDGLMVVKRYLEQKGEKQDGSIL